MKNANLTRNSVISRTSPLPSPRLRSRSLLRPPSFDDSLSVASSLLSLHQDVPSTALISGLTLPSSQLQNGTCCSVHRASVVHLSAPEGRVLSTIDEEMCGIMQTGICRFSELTPGQFGLTKQLLKNLV
uniref:Uncharacterized protein n=1 Tax=Panagrolaimus davidi TaxID=227884 RepID=A0A914PGU9_9BILA